ncbi:MAG: hypothetical protein ACREJ0_17220, partial [Geminicoccaceae bacterium]
VARLHGLGYALGLLALVAIVAAIVLHGRRRRREELGGRAPGSPGDAGPLAIGRARPSGRTRRAFFDQLAPARSPSQPPQGCHRWVVGKGSGPGPQKTV